MEKKAEEQQQTLLQKINAKTNRKFEEFCIDNLLCPECLSDLEQRDEDLVCTTCGFLAPDILNPELSIPFEEPKTPGSELSTGHGMGGTLGRTGMFYVIGHGPNGFTDAPIRAKHIGTIINTVEHPKIMTMIRHGKLLCQNWELDEHYNLNHVIIRNSLGRMIHKVGAYIILSQWHISLKKIVDACFALTLKKMLGEKAFVDVVQKLKVDQDLLVTIDIISTLSRDTTCGRFSENSRTKTSIFPFKDCPCVDCPKKIECYGET
jgi:hypothetical protein